MSRGALSAATQSSKSGASDEWVVELHVFACGHGDTLLLKLPPNRWVLVDCHLTKYDGTRDRFFRYLADHGVRRLDGVFLTHPDSDHYLGMAEVLRQFATPGYELGFFCDSGPNATRVRELLRNKPGEKAYDRLRAAVKDLSNAGFMERRSVNKYSTPLSPTGFKGRVDLVPIAPDPALIDDVFDADVARLGRNPSARPETNSLSVVLVLALAQDSSFANFLLAADADVASLTAALAVWQGYARELKRLSKFDAVKVPHHGSWGSHVPQLAAAPGPHKRIAAISAGDLFALPDRRVIRDFLRNGWRVLATRPKRRRRAGRFATRAMDLLSRRPPSAPPSGDSDLVLRWSPRKGLSCDLAEAEITLPDVVLYGQSSAQ